MPFQHHRHHHPEARLTGQKLIVNLRHHGSTSSYRSFRSQRQRPSWFAPVGLQRHFPKLDAVNVWIESVVDEPYAPSVSQTL